jgi:hypothetical protein
MHIEAAKPSQGAIGKRGSGQGAGPPRSSIHMMVAAIKSWVEQQPTLITEFQILAAVLM